MRVVEEHDIGDSVICDICSTEFKGRPDEGGLLVGSYGVCPLCEPKMLGQLMEFGEEGEIRARCPPGVTFHRFIMDLRGGYNKIRVYTA